MKRRSRAQGSIYRRKGKDGKPEPTWMIAYRAGGRRFTERAFADRAASDQLLAQRLREAAREQVGLDDPYLKHRRRAIAQHVSDFIDGIRSRNRSDKHVSVTQARLRDAFDGMDALTLREVDLPRAEAFLAKVLRKHSAKTRDHYASVLRQFGAWLLDSDRWPRNLFARLRRVATAADVSRERLALSAAEVLRLVDAAEQRPLQEYKRTHPQGSREVLVRITADGWRRGTLYLFSALTGLRKAECAALTWGDVHLAGDAPHVSPRPETTKAGRDEPLPLVEPLLSRLKEHHRQVSVARGGPPPSRGPLFAVPRHLAELVRDDAEFAEIATTDERGRRLDFHALRATFATMIARAGVPLQVGRRLIRHSTPAMTAKHYEKLGLEDLRAGAALVGAAFGAAAAAATDRQTQSDAGMRSQAQAGQGNESKSG